MRIELDAAVKRLRRLEVIFESRAVFDDDEREAQRVAEQLGFDVEIVIKPVRRDNASVGPRREVARVLRHKKKWAVPRIARALHCCERTAGRWVD